MATDQEQGFLQFDGKTNHVAITLQQPTLYNNDFTIEVWFQAEAFPPGAECILCCLGPDSKTANPGACLGIKDGKAFTRLGTNEVIGTQTISLKTWCSIVWRVGHFLDRQDVFINGALDASGSVALATSTPTKPSQAETTTVTTLGCGKGCAYFKGLIGEVRIWNMTRNQLHIKGGMNRCLGGHEPGLVAYYGIRDQDATVLKNLSASGAGNNGTISGAQWTIPLSLTATELPFRQPYTPPAQAGETFNFLSKIRQHAANLLGQARAGFESMYFVSGGEIATLAPDGHSENMASSLYNKESILTFNSLFDHDYNKPEARKDPSFVIGSLDIPVVPFTFEIWIKMAATQFDYNSTIISTPAYLLRFMCTPSRSKPGHPTLPQYDFNLIDPATQRATYAVAIALESPIRQDQWNHLAFTFGTDQSSQAFLNGKLYTTRKLPTPFPTMSGLQRWGVGNSDPNQAFTGEIAQMSIWNHIRTPEQILTDMHQMPSKDGPGLSLWWSWDDWPGRSPKDLGTRPDLSLIHGDIPRSIKWTPLTTPRVATDLVLDPLARKVYWVRSVYPFQVNVSSIDGNLWDAGTTSFQTLFHNDTQPITSVAIDPAQKQIYWIQGTGQLMRGAMNGTGTPAMVLDISAPSKESFWQLDLDLDSNTKRIYWTNDSSIWRCQLDGSAPEMVISGADAPFPIDLAVEGPNDQETSGAVYWIDKALKMIRRADLDGQNATDLYTVPQPMRGLALDVGSHKIYWLELEDNAAQRQFTNITASGDHVYAINISDQAVYQYVAPPQQGIPAGQNNETWATVHKKVRLINQEKMVYHYAGSLQDWKPIGSKATMLVTSSSALYRLQPDSTIGQYHSTSNQWTQIGANATMLVTLDTDLYCLHSDATIWQYHSTSNQWTQIGTNATMLVTLGTTLFCLHPDATIWQYNSKPNDWTHVGDRATVLVAAASHLYCLSTDATIWQYHSKPNDWGKIGTGFTKLSSDGHDLYSIMTDGTCWTYDGKVWAKTSKHANKTCHLMRGNMDGSGKPERLFELSYATSLGILTKWAVAHEDLLIAKKQAADKIAKAHANLEHVHQQAAKDIADKQQYARQKQYEGQQMVQQTTAEKTRQINQANIAAANQKQAAQQQAAAITSAARAKKAKMIQVAQARLNQAHQERSKYPQ